jgi:hypothetical protein
VKKKEAALQTFGLLHPRVMYDQQVESNKNYMYMIYGDGQNAGKL